MTPNARTLRTRPLAATLLLALSLTAGAAPLDDMVALDAAYIPALASTSAAAQNTSAVPRAQAALAALQTQWPTLRRRLGATWGARPPAVWTTALNGAGRQIAEAATAASRADWTQAHEALEPVRLELAKARRQLGMDYAVDRLTAFHGPMEDLARAGATWPATSVDAARRSELERHFAHARARWHTVEASTIDAAAHGLSAARAAQLRQAMDAESAALSRLSDALRADDTARLLKAAVAIKPPFARAFTSFGQSDGDAKR